MPRPRLTPSLLFGTGSGQQVAIGGSLDQIMWGGFATDIVLGGGGDDTISSGSRPFANSGVDRGQLGAGLDQRGHAEFLDGGTGDDVIVCNYTLNVVRASDGDDTVLGFDAGDLLLLDREALASISLVRSGNDIIFDFAGGSLTIRNFNSLNLPEIIPLVEVRVDPSSFNRHFNVAAPKDARDGAVAYTVTGTARDERIILDEVAFAEGADGADLFVIRQSARYVELVDFDPLEGDRLRVGGDKFVLVGIEGDAARTTSMAGAHPVIAVPSAALASMADWLI